MNDYCTYPNKETLVLERLMPASPKIVWEFLTQSAKKEKWLSGGNVEPEIGGKVTHIFSHKKLSDEIETLPEKYKNIPDEVIMLGEVTQWKPYSLLAYTWDEDKAGISEVMFELSEIEPGQTKLVLTHSRIPDSKDFKIGISAGWHTHLNILRDVLSNNKTKGFWGIHMVFEQEYDCQLK